MAVIRKSASLVRLHVWTARQEAAFHGQRVWAGPRVESRPEPGLAPVGVSAASRSLAVGARPQPGLRFGTGPSRAGFRVCRLRVGGLQRLHAKHDQLYPAWTLNQRRDPGGVQLHAATALGLSCGRAEWRILAGDS